MSSNNPSAKLESGPTVYVYEIQSPNNGILK
jgi:hypothetical protein